MAKNLSSEILEIVQSTARNFKAQPLNLGAFGGPGGGVGSPPGGYIGRLPQYQVTYDETEAATSGTLPSGLTGASGWSLVDNLNHIRARLALVESGILVVDEYDGSPSVSNVTQITFSGAMVSQLAAHHALVTVSGIVTNGDAHDHNGGDGAQINHTTLSNIGTYTHAQIDDIDNTGWIPISDSWSYASASTITIPSDGTTKYQKGMPIRFKQGGGYKYYNIATVTSTLITVIVNTDYTVANSAITDIYYSITPTPFGFPLWFARSTTGILTGSGGSAGAYAQTNDVAVYKVLGSSIYESVRITITNVGSWTGNVQLAGAITAHSGESSVPLNGGIWASNTAPGSPKGMPYVTASSNTVYFVSNMGVSNLQWAAMANNDDLSLRAEYRF